MPLRSKGFSPRRPASQRHNRKAAGRPHDDESLSYGFEDSGDGGMPPRQRQQQDAAQGDWFGSVSELVMDVSEALFGGCNVQVASMDQGGCTICDFVDTGESIEIGDLVSVPRAQGHDDLQGEVVEINLARGLFPINVQTEDGEARWYSEAKVKKLQLTPAQAGRLRTQVKKAVKLKQEGTEEEPHEDPSAMRATGGSGSQKKAAGSKGGAYGRRQQPPAASASDVVRQTRDGSEPSASSSAYRKGPRASLAPPTFDPKTHYLIVLQKTKESKLGIDIDPRDGETLLIEAISRNGLIAHWNTSRSKEDPLVRPGDRIVSVNGVAGDCKRIVRAASLPGMLEVMLRRGDESEILKNYHEFKICIDKSKGGRLGASVDRRSPCSLLIEAISEGLLDRWNDTCAAEKRVKPGDMIVEVNEVRGTCAELIAECEKNTDLHMVIRRRGKVPSKTSTVESATGESSQVVVQGKAKQPEASAASASATGADLLDLLSVADAPATSGLAPTNGATQQAATSAASGAGFAQVDFADFAQAGAGGATSAALPPLLSSTSASAGQQQQQQQEPAAAASGGAAASTGASLQATSSTQPAQQAAPAVSRLVEERHSAVVFAGWLVAPSATLLSLAPAPAPTTTVATCDAGGAKADMFADEFEDFQSSAPAPARQAEAAAPAPAPAMATVQEDSGKKAEDAGKDLLADLFGETNASPAPVASASPERAAGGEASLALDPVGSLAKASDHNGAAGVAATPPAAAEPTAAATVVVTSGADGKAAAPAVLSNGLEDLFEAMPAAVAPSEEPQKTQAPESNTAAKPAADEVDDWGDFAAAPPAVGALPEK
eukprot:TRINITY_DN3741_c0_g1_i1.p1 TRINITY_DN3741_c0_g1~~TRINITY_DN3741_c0_g1_i1.p1  ORF type:complete len:832 (-),score=247.29 TRINITY_DN3741_c0_g1_i1:760-3255(-)